MHGEQLLISSGKVMWITFFVVYYSWWVLRCVHFGVLLYSKLINNPLKSKVMKNLSNSPPCICTLLMKSEPEIFGKRMSISVPSKKNEGEGTCQQKCKLQVRNLFFNNP